MNKNSEVARKLRGSSKCCMTCMYFLGLAYDAKANREAHLRIGSCLLRPEGVCPNRFGNELCEQYEFSPVQRGIR